MRATRCIPRRVSAGLYNRASGSSLVVLNYNAQNPIDPTKRSIRRSVSSNSRRFNTTQAQASTPGGEAEADPSHLSGLPASTDLLELYRGLVATGRLRWDDEQVRCVMTLRRLLDTLEDYSPPVELLAQLNPSAPFRIREAASSGSWWKGKGRASDADLLEAYGAQGRELVRVLSGEEELSALSTPKGILITGPPGTGKSLLLSLFFSLLPTPKKRRVHYHAFTLSLYRQVFKEMQRRRDEVGDETREENREVAAAKGWRAVFAGGRWDTESGTERRGWRREDTIPFVIARDMILDYHILYFDELQLVDASSAALLRDVLSWYWRLGGVIVSCSNRVPDDLYHHGVQRDRMASFLDALKSRCDLVELDGGRDWRRGASPDDLPRTDGWFELDDQEFDELWKREGDVTPRSISVYTRQLPIPLATPSACRFTFAELCEEALGPADYISIASTFSRVYIDQVPVLLLKQKNEARRLINLLDALYESRCQLHIRAAAPAEVLFFPDALTLSSDDRNDLDQIQAEALSETLHAPVRPNVSVYNYSPQLAVGQAPVGNTNKGKQGQEGEEGDVTLRDATKGQVGAFGVLGIFTGEDERFAYKRAVSRLIEMTTSPAYAKESWLPLDAEGRAWEGVVSALDSLTKPEIGLDEHDQKRQSSQQPPPSQRARTARPDIGSRETDDFALEAAYSRPTKLTREPPTRPSLRNVGNAAPSGPEGRNDPPGITHARAGSGPRVDPPIIKEQHVWGVREEWGPKAGKWGRGAGAFDKGPRAVGGESGASAGGGGRRGREGGRDEDDKGRNGTKGDE